MLQSNWRPKDRRRPLRLPGDGPPVPVGGRPTVPAGREEEAWRLYLQGLPGNSGGMGEVAKYKHDTTKLAVMTETDWWGLVMFGIWIYIYIYILDQDLGKKLQCSSMLCRG